jgi:hypothetical protein
MTYLIVGLDRSTFTPWHRNISAGDVAAATRLALARAEAMGVRLVVAAVIGPNSTVMSDPAAATGRWPKAA